MAVDLLLSLGGEETGGVEPSRQVDLAGSDSIVFGLVHAQGHEFQVGDHVVQLWAEKHHESQGIRRLQPDHLRL